MKYIININKNQVQKNELLSLIETTLGIVKKHDPVKLGVEPFYKILLEKNTQIDVYRKSRVKHPLSDLISAERIRRDELIKVLKTQLSGINRVSMTSLNAEYALISPIIAMHLNDYQYNNLFVSRAKVNSLLAEFDKNELLVEAAVKLGLGIYIDELRDLQKKLINSEELRLEENSGFRNIDRDQLRTEIFDALKNMFRSIELAKVQHTDQDFDPLIAELNEFLIQFVTIKKSGITRIKNDAQKKETAALSTTTTATAI